MILNDSCQNAYTMFYNIFLEIYNSSFPVKRKSFKPHYKTRKPWLTNGRKCSLKHKNKLYAHYKKYLSQSNKKLYKEYRNMLTRLLRRTERTYYDRLLIDNKNNLKKTWYIIKDVINKKKKSSSSSKFVINGSTVTDNITIAKHLNIYFVIVASKLVSKIPKSKTDPTKTKKKKSRFNIFGKCLQGGSLQNNYIFKKFQSWMG